jgi:hypothetical protein
MWAQERQCKPPRQMVSRPVLADQTRTISHVSLPAAQPKAQDRVAGNEQVLEIAVGRSLLIARALRSRTTS